MPRPRKVPWVAIQIDLLHSGKVAGLPSYAAIVGWVSVLLEAKTQRRMGVFDSDRHFAMVVGVFARYRQRYIDAGLLERADALCHKCRPMHPDLTGAELIVHDYRRDQRDPTGADRQARYEERSRETDDETDGQSDAVLVRAPAATATVTTTSPSSASPPQSRERVRASGPNGEDDWAALRHVVEELTGQAYPLPNRLGGYGAQAADLLARHGLTTVSAAFQAAADAVDGRPTVRQLVFAAGDVLDTVPKVSRRHAEDAEAASLRRRFEGDPDARR